MVNEGGKGIKAVVYMSQEEINLVLLTGYERSKLDELQSNSDKADCEADLLDNRSYASD